MPVVLIPFLLIAAFFGLLMWLVKVTEVENTYKPGLFKTGINDLGTGARGVMSGMLVPCLAIVLGDYLANNTFVTTLAFVFCYLLFVLASNENYFKAYKPFKYASLACFGLSVLALLLFPSVFAVLLCIPLSFLLTYNAIKAHGLIVLKRLEVDSHH